MLNEVDKEEQDKRRILNVNAPMISTYPELGHLFSMLDLESNNVWNWIYKNFIHIVLYGGNRVTYKHSWGIINTCPFISNYSYPLEFITCKFKSIDEFIIEKLEKDYYVVLTLNRRYLPGIGQRC